MALPPKNPPPGVKIIPNAPLYPPNPSDTQAASPGPQASGPLPPPGPPPGPPPQASRTVDNYTHHTSPAPGNVQAPAPVPPPPANASRRVITGGPPKRVTVPQHVTKHPNPVGRPKNSGA
jgi:hypothetical protein